ncbi:Acetate kinase [Helicobacter bizzozeronii]|nr:Acetate kinase [Helicobacter bizzozeronii]
MRILVLNLGSSSIKFQLFNMDKGIVLAKGLVEQIGEEYGRIKINAPGGHACIQDRLHIKDHEEGLLQVQEVLKELQILRNIEHVDGVGHRVVQGGDLFIQPTLIDDRVMEHIERLCPLAPLHNPVNLAGIKALKKQVPNLPQVAVFDTAFHQSMPAHAYVYALPYHLYEQHKLRRYGFHGTSHQFIAQEAAKFLNIPYDQFNAISLHLGNGASACAIQGGKSIDTSMGLTPLEGLVMGTRSGDMDPALIEYIMELTHSNIKQATNMLNKQSGLKGVCGDNDMRGIEAMIEKGDAKAKLAFDIYAYRIKKYVGAYAFALGRVDALLFTGGVGENCARLREVVCAGLENFGICLDTKANATPKSGIAPLQAQSSKVAILRVPTNEELAIAQQSAQVILQMRQKSH